MKKSREVKGVHVVASGTAINLALGALYTWSMLKSGLMEQFGLTASQGALPYTTACLVFALFMVPAGRMLDRFGPRMVATLGGILVGGGFIISSLSSQSNSVLMLTIGFGIMAGAGIGFGYAAATPAAIKWFPPEKKGLVTGIVVGGFGLASVYIAPLTKWLISSYGITLTFRILGVLFLIIIVGFAQLLRNPPEGYVPAGAKSAGPSGGLKPAAKVGKDFAWKEMIHTPQFVLIWLMFAFGAGSGLMLISFAKGMAKGSIADIGFVLVAILAIGNAGGRVIAGVLSDKIGRMKTMLMVFLGQALVLVILAKFSNPIVIIAGVVMVGFNYGSCLSVFPSITADFFGMKNFGVNYGLVFTAWGIGSIMAMVAGRVQDVTGSYSGAMVMAAVLCVAAAVITVLVKPPSSEPHSGGKHGKGMTSAKAGAAGR